MCLPGVTLSGHWAYLSFNGAHKSKMPCVVLLTSTWLWYGNCLKIWGSQSADLPGSHPMQVVTPENLYLQGRCSKPPRHPMTPVNRFWFRSQESSAELVPVVLWRPVAWGIKSRALINILLKSHKCITVKIYYLGYTHVKKYRAPESVSEFWAISLPIIVEFSLKKKYVYILLWQNVNNRFTL